MRAGWANFAVAGTGLAVYLLLAWQVSANDSKVLDIDRDLALSAQLHSGQSPALLNFARHATDYGGIPVMVAMSVAGAMLLWMCGQPKLALVWLLAAAGGGAIDLGCKELVNRERPDASMRDSAVTERNESFPSGHAMGSTIGYGALAFVGVILLQRRWAKLTIAILMMIIVGTICWSRVYLRAHWCSDVIAGVALGMCWLSVCFSLRLCVFARE